MTHGNQHESLLAYLAGIVDGEGTIRIARIHSTAMRQQRQNPHHTAALLCKMTHKPTVDLLMCTFGGHVYKRERVPGRKQCWQWILSGNRACLHPLLNLYPYLRIKKPQASLTLDLIANSKTTGFQRRQGLPTMELQWREDLYQSVRKLNAVGERVETERENPEKGCDSPTSCESMRGEVEAPCPPTLVVGH